MVGLKLLNVTAVHYDVVQINRISVVGFLVKRNVTNEL